MANGHGGKRRGAGIKAGFKYPKTLTKEAAREVLRQQVMKELGPMVSAQVKAAQGLKYLVTRDKKSGKFTTVTQAMARVMINAGESDSIEVWEKEPSTAAFSDLANRALDRPKEQKQEINLTGEAELIMALMAGRQRAAQRKAGDGG